MLTSTAVPTVLVPPDFEIDHSDILSDEDLEIFRPPKIAKLDTSIKPRPQKPIRIRQAVTPSINYPVLQGLTVSSRPLVNPAPKLKIASTKSISPSEFASTAESNIRKVVFGFPAAEAASPGRVNNSIQLSVYLRLPKQA